MSRLRLTALTVVLAIGGSPLVAEQSRIQLDGWSDPARGIAEPLTQVVAITRGDRIGTGTFLPECRIVSALHVLFTDAQWTARVRSKHPRSLVGEWINFETKNHLSGSMLVLGHGRPTGSKADQDSEEDWVVGYDPACLSQTKHLGFVRLATAELKGKEFVTAGRSLVDVARDFEGNYSLYVDSQCRVSDDQGRRPDQRYLLTNCSVWHGGSGQLLLAPRTLDGRIVFERDGRPELLAYGMVLAVNPAYPDPTIPNTRMATGVAPFTAVLVNKLRPFLTGPVDVTAIENIARTRRQGILDDRSNMGAR